METPKVIKLPKTAVLALIEACEQHECLYNPRSELYHLESIAKELESYITGISPSDVKTKINYLRTQYCREGISSVSMVVDVDPLPEDSVPSSAKKIKSVQVAPEDEILFQAKELLKKVAQPLLSTNRYDESLLLFLQENLAKIRDKDLKDELSEEIIALVMQCKRKQRTKDMA